MFYNIPCVGNMIAARQLDFLGKTVHGSSDRPAQQKLTACCNTICRIGRPFFHNKDYNVRNLRLLFTNVPEVTISKYGSLKHWTKEAPQRISPKCTKKWKCLSSVFSDQISCAICYDCNIYISSSSILVQQASSRAVIPRQFCLLLQGLNHIKSLK